MGRTFVLGDIHGAHRALVQCLERSSFRRDEDELIFLGDACDGWPETKACMDELCNIPNLVFILGNHDWWMLEWMKGGRVDDLWYSQGGKATIDSYSGNVIPESHINLLDRALPYVVRSNKLFVHAGINPDMPVESQSLQTFLWDRTLARKVIHHANDPMKKFTTYDEVFVGHTPISGGVPIRCGEVWMMDTGAGWTGNLSMMNVDTKEVFVSYPVPNLYPGVVGRSRT